jgi:copper chaperone CopZ
MLKEQVAEILIQNDPRTCVKVYRYVLSGAQINESYNEGRKAIKELKGVAQEILNLFKAEVDKLTVIEDKEITRHELPDGDYDITGLCQAQLQHTKKQILDLMGE